MFRFQSFSQYIDIGHQLQVPLFAGIDGADRGWHQRASEFSETGDHPQSSLHHDFYQLEDQDVSSSGIHSKHFTNQHLCWHFGNSDNIQPGDKESGEGRLRFQEFKVLIPNGRSQRSVSGRKRGLAQDTVVIQTKQIKQGIYYKDQLEGC